MARNRPLLFDKEASSRGKRIARKLVGMDGEIRRFTAHWLRIRDNAGMPTPDPEIWGTRMMRFIIGLSCLHLGVLRAEEEGIPLEEMITGVPGTLRGLLTHPLFDCPADDTDLLLWLLLYPEPPAPGGLFNVTPS